MEPGIYFYHTIDQDVKTCLVVPTARSLHVVMITSRGLVERARPLEEEQFMKPAMDLFHRPEPASMEQVRPGGEDCRLTPGVPAPEGAFGPLFYARPKSSRKKSFWTMGPRYQRATAPTLPFCDLVEMSFGCLSCTMVIRVQ